MIKNKNLILPVLVTFLMMTPSLGQTIFVTKGGKVSFFSSTPLEDIAAENNSTKGILNIAKHEVHLIVPVRQFKFPKSLMEEHFNENYMESEKFPTATYDGIINEKPDLTKDGSYEVTTTGKLTIHGVSKDVTEKGKLVVKGKSITLTAAMKVKVADFNIQIPQVVFQNIAEVIDVKMDIPFEEYVKPAK